MNKKCETFVVDINKFGDRAWDTVKYLLKIMSEADYVCSVRTEENLIIIEYQDSDPNIGGAVLRWLSISEFESVVWDGEFIEDDSNEY